MRSFEICGCERGTTLGLGLSACGSKLRVRGCVLLYLDLTWARMGRRTSETTSLSPIWAKTGRRILRPDSKQVGDSPSPTCLRRLMRSLRSLGAGTAPQGFQQSGLSTGLGYTPLPASEGSERDGSVCSSTSICSSSVSQQTKEGTIWESSQDVHTWALLSGGVDKTRNWRKYASEH